MRAVQCLFSTEVQPGAVTPLVPQQQTPPAYTGTPCWEPPLAQACLVLKSSFYSATQLFSILQKKLYLLGKEIL